MKVKLLPYFLFILLPTQLGKYFFLPISYISGLRSDYLAISFYLSDIISILIILGFFLKNWNKNPFRLTLPFFPIFLCLLCLFLYLLLSSLFISTSPIISLFKLSKLLEMSLLCFVLINSKLDIFKIIFSISLASFYSSALAIAQFAKGGSLNGLWWFLGERTFTTSTPGIATFSLNGMRFLRPYAAFPHPNVLAGFLAVSSLAILWYLKYKKLNSQKVFYYFAAVLSLSLVALILTASRSAIVAYLAGIILLVKPIKWNGRIILGLLGVVIFSIFIPLFIPSQSESILERKALIEKSFEIVSHSLVFGVGLNEFITIPNSKTYLLGVSSFQPVHNVFLLMLSEGGVVGVFLFLILQHLIFYDLKLLDSSFMPILFSLFSLSLFDHYLFTLQEGMLITVAAVSIAFLARKKYT